MYGGGAEAGTATIKEMVGSVHSGYTRDKSGACRRGGRGRRRNWREMEREIRIGKDGGREAKMTRRTRDYQTEILRIRHNLARNPIVTAPNAPLDSAPGKQFHPPILSLIAMNGGQVNRDIICLYSRIAI